MGRMVWMTVGAVGGIVAYRKGQRMAVDARERGFVGNLQAVAGATVSVANGAAKVATLVGQPPVKPLTVAELTQDSAQARIEVPTIRRSSKRLRKKPVPVTAIKFKAHSQAANAQGPHTERVVDVRERRVAAVS